MNIGRTPWFSGLGFLSMLCVGIAGHAQSSVDTAATSSVSRLTVRPHTVQLGKATTTDGIQQLDSLPGYFVYVPKNCVGTRRVPLVVFLHGGGGNGKDVIEEQREMADQYGMILLAPTAADEGWDVVYHAGNTGATAPDEVPRPLVSRNVITQFQDVKNINRAMRYVLEHFAIDPDKIALGGFSDGGTYASFLGRNNENVFSQVMVMSPFDRFDGSLGARNTKTRFLVVGGTNEPPGAYVLSVAHDLRAEGHDVETILSERSHTFLIDERNYAWNWLAQGWKWNAPNVVKPIRPVALPENDSLLTPDAIAKLTAFWTAVTAEPDSIQSTALKTHQVYGTMMIGQERVIVVTTDLAAIVAAYPSIAADLAKAGLTIQQEEAYRLALLRMHFFDVTGSQTKNPTIQQNLALRESYLGEEMKALWNTNIWIHEDVKHQMKH